MKKRVLTALMLCSTHASALLYTVQPGDTLYRIAKTYQSDVQTLAELNGLSHSTLQVGQVLNVPVRAPSDQQTLLSGQQTPVIPKTYRDNDLPPKVPGKLQRGLFVPQFGFHLSASSTQQARIYPTQFQWQTRNNCGPAAISALLSYYGLRIPQQQYQQRLRPGRGYMSVESGVALLKDLGFQVRHQKNSTLSQLKAALASGPILVLQWHSKIGKTPHFRVVTGFDANQGLFYLNDSLSGPLVALSEHDFDLLWNTQGRQMVAVSR